MVSGLGEQRQEDTGEEEGESGEGVESLYYHSATCAKMEDKGSLCIGGERVADLGSNAFSLACLPGGPGHRRDLQF